MSNIDKFGYSVYDVQDYIKSNTDNFQMNKPLEVVNVNSTSFNNGTSRDYPFWQDILNPETGEKLRAVKGYVGHDELGRDRCYYAEFADKNGKTYSYTYQFAMYKDGVKLLDTKSIKSKMAEDLKQLQENLKKEEEKNKAEDNKEKEQPKKEDKKTNEKNEEFGYEFEI